MGLGPSAILSANAESKARSIKFRLIRFRSPLLTESTFTKATADKSAITLEKDNCSLFLRVLRCFNSPGTRPSNKFEAHSDFIGIGYPIRKSSVQRLLATSPKLIAGCYVLHRLLMSRHSPYTLKLFFTLQFLLTDELQGLTLLYNRMKLQFLYF